MHEIQTSICTLYLYISTEYMFIFTSYIWGRLLFVEDRNDTCAIIIKCKSNEEKSEVTYLIDITCMFKFILKHYGCPLHVLRIES